MDPKDEAIIDMEDAIEELDKEQRALTERVIDIDAVSVDCASRLTPLQKMVP